MGALAPFGSIYKIPTYWDKGLDKPKKVLLNAGSFTESIEMTPAQYKKIEEQVEADLVGDRELRVEYQED